MYEDIVKALNAKIIEGLMLEPPDFARARGLLRIVEDLTSLSVTRIGQLEPIGGMGIAAPALGPYRPPPAERAMSELVEAAHSFSQPRPPTLDGLASAYVSLFDNSPDLALRIRSLIDRALSTIEAEGEKKDEDLRSELPG